MSAIGRVLVVGAGIGGLSASIALRRHGVEVDLIERNPAWDVYGVGIIQPGNALRALAELGVAEECVALGHPILGQRSWLADGVTPLHDDAFPALLPGLPPANGITRTRFHSILVHAVRESGAEVRTGVVVTALRQRESGVDVEFSDGHERSYDLLVGADGLYSQIRDMVFGTQYQAKFTGEVGWRINLPRIPELDRLSIYRGSAGSAGFCPLGPDLMYMLTIEKAPAGRPVRLPREGLARVYRERLAEYGGPIAEHRELVTNDADVVYRPIDTVLVPPPWYRGRVLLIGDAAHGTSPQCGQGGAQAIEDGVVLAEEVARDIPAEQVLANFMARRFERCRTIVQGSEQIGRWEQDHSLDIDPDAVAFEVTMAAMAPL
ncbi:MULTISPECIES: FAD-dependent monooxygenase [Amycolatopsis]|uniref:FAD-dependent monooxygenase n=1 Tax=Amycolatopsis thermalba TaxID=944492 RepID=A0ABY4NXQ5_9PSEU|nr:MULTISPECIES: FAD-dependent monooxygenase [Amycolatopsis]OXM72297.1 2-polyprenyl-6-methoxyphenol hydroxylase [Amycolatopsis sp. KNN50.9b]UQS24778.1 FAD-dependent monooxygenase [Amycolatopsis thermalba]